LRGKRQPKARARRLAERGVPRTLREWMVGLEREARILGVDAVLRCIPIDVGERVVVLWLR
jgi:hypothetical protein